MPRYVLRPEISREEIENLSLSYELIKGNGVIYIKEIDRPFIGEDSLEHHTVIVIFRCFIERNKTISIP